ncbi:MAG: hypothetical protein HY391_00350, partial [Deltaproteobacteria bacterium]|nr:hypothetical protein [Deltaproteobacteria bacterium]
MSSTYLIRHSEIHLKGRNRPWFEKLLLENIQMAFLKKQIEAQVENAWRRMFVTTNCDSVTHREIIGHIFGIASFSPITTVASEYSAILNGTLSSLSRQLLSQTKKRFRVSVNRIDKAFPLTSVHLEKKIGEAIL